MLLTRLAANWPRSELLADKRLQYIACIADLPFDVGEMVVAQALTTCKWFPEVAEFRAIAGGLYQRATGRPPADEAWAEFKAGVRRFGMYGTPRWSHPAVERTAAIIGFRDFCLSETREETIWRAQFMRVYEAQGEREVAEMQMLPSVHRKLGQLAASMSRWRLEAGLPDTATDAALAPGGSLEDDDE